MIKEPTLEQIWEARRRIYAKCDNDPVKLVQGGTNFHTIRATTRDCPYRMVYCRGNPLWLP